MPDKVSTNERPALECASVTWKFGPIRVGSLRPSKFLQVGARAALHLRRTGNTAEWKTIACRTGEGGACWGRFVLWGFADSRLSGLGGVSDRPCHSVAATRLFRYFSERVRMSSEDWEFMKGKRPRSLKVNKVFLQDLTATKEVRMWWPALTGCHSPP